MFAIVYHSATVSHVGESLNLCSAYRLAIGIKVHMGVYKLERFLLEKFHKLCSKQVVDEDFPKVWEQSVFVDASCVPRSFSDTASFRGTLKQDGFYMVPQWIISVASLVDLVIATWHKYNYFSILNYCMDPKVAQDKAQFYIITF